MAKHIFSIKRWNHRFPDLTWTALWKRWQNRWKTRQASSSLKVLSSSQKNSIRAWLDILIPSTSSSASFKRSSATCTQREKHFTILIFLNNFSRSFLLPLLKYWIGYFLVCPNLSCIHVLYLQERVCVLLYLLRSLDVCLEGNHSDL